eukprot:NODE_2143_length_1672_cov_100.601033_g1832_i0.p1 GENE.NODE_2143_length_1672_cov_100.601033_g1832_i0~~NODE_2143_length_1672_cov_100.601033_g1832_i0.p1  ORF type:complete len:456 (-),score=103.54 NODE_2143_length_1672_cov_100.601033_g1832_i0:239-1606(-)
MSVTGVILALFIAFALACDNSQKCQSSSDCCDGQKCFEKNQWWAGCKPSCDPNWVDPYDGLKWSCKQLGGNCDSSGSKQCSSNSDCCAGFQCFEKNQWWSACKQSCDRNWVDPYDNQKWSCNVLGGGNSGGNSGTCGAFKEGYDVVGSNLAEKPVGSAQECCDLCKSMPNCQAAALWNNICYPKASADIVAKGGVTAIVKSGGGNVVGGNTGGGGGGSSSGGDLYCPTGNDMNLEFGSVSFKNGGWEMTGSARVSSKTAWNLLGGYMEWDMDLSRVADEVNTNFYTSSPSRPNCGSNCYCDIQAGSFVSCMELDFLENNGKCVGNTALHMFPTDGRAGNANCDRWGCNSVTAKYSNPANLHFRAEVGNDGYVKVFVNGAPNTNYGPQPSGEANNVVVRTMQTIGAVIESSQWFGWVPAENMCPRGNSGALGGSFVRVMNVKVKGKVVQGPVPNKC